ncbi:MAG TPA: hypothetical protein VKQ11_09835 [Candidatus Sulfotelmatobacter sp.]|nr:hypothetical protein [Candidatus Sulfotelmatobacter sp.]
MKHEFDSTKRRPLDDQLDAALANYAAVEPRAGLEERILANLKSQERSSTRVAWWRWAGALAAIILVTMLVLWRAQKRNLPPVAGRPANSQERVPPRVVASSMPAKQGRPVAHVAARKASKHIPAQAALATAGPKLDQFPSPQPLTAKEKMLLDYVDRYHDEAVLMARAREEQLEQDRAEEEAERADHP